MTAEELKKQFTQKMVDSIILYANMVNYFESGYFKKEDLKLFVIAEYNNNFRGVFRGVRYIVMVPYEENKKLWSLKTQPNDFFLIFPEDGVTLQ